MSSNPDSKRSPLGRRIHLDTATPLKISATARHTCRMCASGCRNYDIMLTEAEVRRLSLNIWRPLLHEVPETLPLVLFDNVTGQHLLNKVEGRCVFLDSDDLCIIHKSSGAEDKPVACQFFPLHAIGSPAGIHISLNTGCRRLVEMTDQDDPLSPADATRLLAQVEAITTIPDVMPLTPEQMIPYTEFVDWQNRLRDILTVPDANYWPRMQAAAELLLTIPGDSAPLEWTSLFAALHKLIGGLHPERPSAAVLFARTQRWLPALLTNPVPPEIPFAYGPFYAAIAGQYLEGHQAALHRTARTGWVALLAALVAGIGGTVHLMSNSPDATINIPHTLNNTLSDALELFFAPAGQLALTEPNQDAFLRGLLKS